MSIIRLFRLGIRVAAWATPRVQEWHRERQMNQNESQRHLDAKNWAEAETHLIAALKEKRSTKVRGELLAKLSKAQLHQKKFDEAAESANACVELAGNDPNLLWGALEALTSIQLAQGDTTSALETLESMDESEKSRPKPEPVRLLKTSRKRGNILAGLGRTFEARAAFDETLKLAEQAHGADHLETAHVLAEDGALCRKIGDHPLAQQRLQRALTIYRTTQEFHSVQSSESLRHLALSLEECGNLDGATAEYERFVSVCERQVGGNAKDLVHAQVRLSSLYVRSGRSSAARELLGPAIGALEREKGEALREALEIMALAEEQAGRRAEAAACRARAESITPTPATPR
jgi:tetratricopeptide (TPR) repeat protein